MGLMNVFTGDDEVLRLAEAKLRDTENKVFEMMPGEEHDLATHVRADLPRFETIYRRQYVESLRSARASHRNFVLLAVTFGLVAAKSFGVLDWAFHVLTVL